MAKPSPVANSPSRTKPHSAPAAGLRQCHDQSTDPNISHTLDPQGSANHMSASTAAGKINSELFSQDRHNVESTTSDDFQDHHFTSVAASNRDKVAGTGAGAALSKAKDSQNLVHSTSAGADVANGINSVIGKEDGSSTINAYETDPRLIGSYSARRGGSLADSNGFGGAKTNFDLVQTVASSDPNTPAKPYHKQNKGGYEFSTEDQATPAQTDPGAATGQGETSQSIQPDSHISDLKGFLRDHVEVGGLSVVRNPRNSEDLLIGSQHLGKGQATDIAGTPISVGSSDVVFDRTLTVPFDSIPVGASGVAASVYLQNPQTLDDSGETTISDQLSPVTTIPGETKTTKWDQSTASSGIVVSIGMGGFIIAGLIPKPHSSLEPGIHGSAHDIAVQVPFTILGHHFTAYEVAGHDHTAVIPGANSQLTTTSAGGPAVRLNGQTVSMALDGIHIPKSGTEEIIAAWSTVTATDNDLPSNILSTVASSSSTAPSQTPTTDITVPFVYRSGAERTLRSGISPYFTLWIWIWISVFMGKVL